MYQREKILVSFLEILTFVLLVCNTIAYFTSGLVSRIVLIASFLVLIITVIWGYKYQNKWISQKTVFTSLILASLMFLSWRSSFTIPHYIEKTLHSETFVLAQQYGQERYLKFDSPHSYFFMSPLTLRFLYDISGFSAITSIYIWLAIYGILVAMVSTLVLKSIWRRTTSEGDHKVRAQSILPPLVAISLVSFAFSERLHLPLLLMLLVFFILFDKGFRSWNQAVVILILVVAVTLGSTTGILLLIPFFFVFSIFGKTKTVIVYALIPLTYLLYSAYSYALSLKTYATFAWQGFLQFLKKVLLGQVPERVIPWERTNLAMEQDVFITSITYFSLILLSFTVTVLSTYLLIKKERKSRNVSIFSGTTCLWFIFVVAMVTYLGASTKAETPISDIRTIVIVLVSLLLPFLFISKETIMNINARKVLLISMTTLMVVASLRTIYEIYPKSIYDPINVAEDSRLGSTSIYVVGDFINLYYVKKGIIWDYNALIRIGRLVPSSYYETRLLDETVLNRTSIFFLERNILVFSIAGTKYPSIYHSTEAYMAAYNFGIAHNILYDNGVVLICQKESMSKP